MTGSASTTAAEESVNAESVALRALRQEIHLTLIGFGDRIRDLQSWGTVLIHLGASNDRLDHDAVTIVGKAVHQTADYLRDDFRNILADINEGAQA